MNALVESRIARVGEICRRHGVERLDLFGSAAKDRDGFFDPNESDVDFVVSFERRVDLVMEGAVRKNPRFARSIEESRVPVYASRG